MDEQNYLLPLSIYCCLYTTAVHVEWESVDKHIWDQIHSQTRGSRSGSCQVYSWIFTVDLPVW